MAKVSQRIEWTERHGWGEAYCAVESDWCETSWEARAQAKRLAVKCGWTPPRWWQWWRWDDTRPSTRTAFETATIYAKLFNRWHERQWWRPYADLVEHPMRFGLLVLGLWKWFEILGWLP